MKFESVLPRDQVDDDDIARLKSSTWRMVVAALYLRTGRYIPDEAKARGVWFGYCDAEGNQLGRADASATHFGWSADREGSKP